MENVILCNGRYAQNPYLLEEENLRIYSVEELCYFLYKNSFLIQEDFFSETLFEWIGKELELEEWANRLRSFKGNDEEILRSMEFLFQVSGFYGEEELNHVRRVLKDSSQLSVYERKKVRADSYYKKQRYLKAATEYEQLLRESAQDQVKFRAKLYHNLGCCAAGMFFYEKAADYFLQAFHTYPNTETYVQFLASLKLGSSQEEYLVYLSEHPESYEDSLEVESRLKSIEQQWEKMPFDEALQERMEENNITYYNVIKQLLRQAKEDYIKMVDKR